MTHRYTVGISKSKHWMGRKTFCSSGRGKAASRNVTVAGAFSLCHDLQVPRKPRLKYKAGIFPKSVVWKSATILYSKSCFWCVPIEVVSLEATQTFFHFLTHVACNSPTDSDWLRSNNQICAGNICGLNVKWNRTGPLFSEQIWQQVISCASNWGVDANVLPQEHAVTLLHKTPQLWQHPPPFLSLPPLMCRDAPLWHMVLTYSNCTM